VPVSRETLQRVSEAVPAELLPYEQTDLYAKVSGFLKEIKVDYGDRVKKGDVLAVLWIPELEKEYEQEKAVATRAEADVRLAEEAVRAAEAESRRSRSQHERLKRVGRGGVIDQEAVEETQYRFEASKARWGMARADVGVKQASLLVARADRDQVAALLEYTRVGAPYDGVITRRYLHTGAFITTGRNDQPLLTVMRTDQLRVVVDVPEKDVRYLDKADTVRADLDALPGKQFTWKITRLAPVLGAGKKVRVEVDIPNPDGTLYPGMYGHASVILEEKSGALTVPRASLGNDEQGAFVWLVADGKARRQRVTVGLTRGERAEITSGLSGTEEVVCGGPRHLREGQPVTPQRGQGAKGPRSRSAGIPGAA
jgi:RND family efflux transporter MFP subunit